MGLAEKEEAGSEVSEWELSERRQHEERKEMEEMTT